MSNTDRSASSITRAARNRTLAAFYRLNPTMRGPITNAVLDAESYIARISGQNISTDCCISAAIACTPPGSITNFISSEPQSTVPPYNTTYAVYFELSWDPVPGATSYTITSSFGTDLVVSTGSTTANIYTTDEDSSIRTFTLTAITACGTTAATTMKQPCFLAGSLVQMADGSTKAIEDVFIGDSVVGAFGEINTVLALHRPLLGNALLCRINGEHSTTNHHPHISVDKKFYCGDPELVSRATYGCTHTVIDATGQQIERMLHGLKKDRIHKLHIGVNLKTIDGSRCVYQLETYSMDKTTQLYNLVIDGSHTYHVDGYAVTGWPREDDFNYDTWST